MAEAGNRPLGLKNGIQLQPCLYGRFNQSDYFSGLNQSPSSLLSLGALVFVAMKHGAHVLYNSGDEICSHVFVGFAIKIG